GALLMIINYILVRDVFTTYTVAIAVEFGLESSVTCINGTTELVPLIGAVFISCSLSRTRGWGWLRYSLLSRCWLSSRLSNRLRSRFGSRLRYSLLNRSLLWCRRIRDNSWQRIRNHALLYCPVHDTGNSCDNASDDRNAGDNLEVRRAFLNLVGVSNLALLVLL